MLKISRFFILLAWVCSFALGTATCAKPFKCNEETVDLKKLIFKPESQKNKTINIEGQFYSFSTLPLDYPKAFKSSKDYIGIVLSRPDLKQIPLVELKIAVPIKKFKDKSLSMLEHDDLVRIKAKVYAVALGEPWLEVLSMEVQKNSNTDNNEE